MKPCLLPHKYVIPNRMKVYTQRTNIYIDALCDCEGELLNVFVDCSHATSFWFDFKKC